MTIELYVFPGSPRAFKVLALARYLGLPYEMKRLDSLKGEHKSAGYAELNPNLRMPTLKEGDYVLWESHAILHYLAEKVPAAGLIPTDTLERIDMLRWQFWDNSHWDPVCSVFIYEHFVKPIFGLGEADPAALEKGAGPFHHAATVLNERLRGRSYVLGDRISIADFSLASVLNLTSPAQIPIGDYAEIQRWYGSMSALPAWQETLEMTARPAG